jgi:hypothetical protein
MTAVGHVHLHTCYVFEVTCSATELRQTDTLEVTATLSGLILNHRSIVVRLRSAEAAEWATDPISFMTVQPGTYVAWIPLASLEPGVYRGSVFLRAQPNTTRLASVGNWLGHRDIERTFLIRIEPEE